MKRALLALALVFLVGACGGEATLETGPTVEPSESRVYFVRDGKVWPLLRMAFALEPDDLPSAALAELLVGPTEREVVDLMFSTAIPEGTEVSSLEVENGVARLELSAELPDEPVAQVVFTLTQFPTIESVEIQGKTYTRADFEDFTPAILVESPLPFEEVGSPLRVTGTANTFEANFSYELTDTDGLIVDENFVTATSGTGTRGTFDFTTKPYTVKFDGVGALIVFERSAKDGSKIHLVEIPLRMTR